MNQEDITPLELKNRLENGNRPILLDVREPEEVAICVIDGAIHVPMGQIPLKYASLGKHAHEEIVVYCHHGMRSANVKQFLKQKGFSKVRNLTGGIEAYSREADQSLARY